MGQGCQFSSERTTAAQLASMWVNLVILAFFQVGVNLLSQVCCSLLYLWAYHVWTRSVRSSLRPFCAQTARPCRRRAWAAQPLSWFQTKANLESFSFSGRGTLLSPCLCNVSWLTCIANHNCSYIY